MEEIQHALKEGEFRGTVLTELRNIKESLTKIDEKHDISNKKVELELEKIRVEIGGKADKSTVETNTKAIARHDRILWKVTGAFITLSVLWTLFGWVLQDWIQTKLFN